MAGAIYAMTKKIWASGSALLLFQGDANRLIQWSVVSGSGAITALSSVTDASGRCYAKYQPNGYVGQVVIQATYGG